MRRILIATVSSRMGGAERLILDLVKSQSNVAGSTVSLGILDQRFKGGLLEHWAGSVVGLWQFMFGSYDLIHSHLFVTGLLVRIRRLWDSDFHWIHTLHYVDYAGLRFGKLKAFLDRKFVFPETDFLVAVSDSVFHEVKRFTQAIQIDNGIDLKLGLHRERNARSSKIVLGTIAMLREEKGLADLIRAMGSLRSVFPQIELKIAGEGPQRKELEKLIQQEGLNDSVELLGFVSNLERFFASIDIYIQPSRSESFGIAVLEAFQAGKPVVASAVGNLPNLLQHQRFGILVSREGDFQKFCQNVRDALQEISENLWTYQEKSLDGLDYWRDRLDSAKTATAYQRLYVTTCMPGICMVAPVVTQATGGLQKQILLQSRELTSLGHRVFILQRKDPAAVSYTKQWKHVQFWETPDFAGRLGQARWVTRPRGLEFAIEAFLLLVLHRKKYAVIHAHQLYSPTLAGVVAKILLKKKLVVKVTASGILGEVAALKKLPFYPVRRFLFRFIDRVIVLTPEMRDEVLSLGIPGKLIEVIPNGVDFSQEFIPVSLRNVQNQNSSPFKILYCGRLSTEKRLETLIEAAEVLQKRSHFVEVDIVGEPFLERNAGPMLTEMAKRLEHRVTIRFHGFQPSVQQFYEAADCFVLPSESEGLSNALLEALSYGLPCVVSDIGPNRFLVEDQVNGFLFKMGNAESLAASLELLVVDRSHGKGERARALSTAAKQMISSRFSSQAIAGRLSKLYETVSP